MPRPLPGTRLDVVGAETKRGNWVPVLVNFAVEPRLAGSGSSHQLRFLAITRFYQNREPAWELGGVTPRRLYLLWGVPAGKGEPASNKIIASCDTVDRNTGGTSSKQPRWT